MKRYSVTLLILTAVLVLASFVVLWSSPTLFHVFMPVVVLYFTLVTGIEHYLILKSAQRDPRTFVKNFMGLTVGTLLLHLAVLTLYIFTHLQVAKLFVITFCICYIVYLVFETVSLVLFVKNQKK